MWCLMAAPLIFSGDMAKLDPFTLNVLCNAEVIDIDQDPLGKQARVHRRTDNEIVLVKPMEDGSLAVGLFNLLEQPREMTATWEQLGIKGKNFFMPLRVALTGRVKGPEIYFLLPVIGRDRAVKRLDRAISIIGEHNAD